MEENNTMRKIKQLRYTSPPEGNLINGMTVYELGIYGMPGISFYLNEADFNNKTDKYITLNATGVLTLNANDFPLTYLSLRPIDSSIEFTAWNLIIDVIYEEAV